MCALVNQRPGTQGLCYGGGAVAWRQAECVQWGGPRAAAGRQRVGEAWVVTQIRRVKVIGGDRVVTEGLIPASEGADLFRAWLTSDQQCAGRCG